MDEEVVTEVVTEEINLPIFTSLERGKGESFEDYKTRRHISNILSKQRISGFWDTTRKGQYFNEEKFNKRLAKLKEKEKHEPSK